MTATRDCVRFGPAVALGAVLLGGFAGAEVPAPLTLEHRAAGPVNMADLQVLLGRDSQFQTFDFESSEHFCLGIGYLHEVDGARVAGLEPGSSGICNRAGAHRLIVVLQRHAGQRPQLTVGLHDRSTGVGGSFSHGPIDIPEERFDSWARSRPAETLTPEVEVTLLRWSFGRNDQAGQHHLLVVARLIANPAGAVRSGSLP